MKTWAENKPGRPGGSDFTTSDIGEVGELPEEMVTDARSLISRFAKDAEDKILLYEALGL